LRQLTVAKVRWYRGGVGGTYSVTMGNRGWLVVPVELRERAGMREGTVLVLLETDSGVVLLTREQLKHLVRKDLAGGDLVEQLLAERRANALAEDVA